jgi:hypothetical protein
MVAVAMAALEEVAEGLRTMFPVIRLETVVGAVKLLTKAAIHQPVIAMQDLAVTAALTPVVEVATAEVITDQVAAE